MRSVRSLDRVDAGRYLAALAGVVALLCFYAPWVAASLPGAGEGVLSGAELAGGAAAQRAGSSAGDAAARPGPATGAASGGLVLPTRQPTVTPAGQAAGAGGAQAGAAGGLVLPTRLPTVAPSDGAGGGAAVATSAAATAVAVQTARPAGPAPLEAAPAGPAALPTLILYAVPLAGAGLAILAAIWGRFTERRDRLYGQLWTLLLSAGGALGAGSLLYQVLSAPQPNDLLAPGEVRGAQWGLWGTLVAFTVAALSLVAAWTAPRAAHPVLSRPLRRSTPSRVARSASSTRAGAPGLDLGGGSAAPGSNGR
ncbi:MAG TPA: hypothetical protein VHS99_20200 [Chloroflexota bacterium]|nr:hypothetical protein [Chloroflexota bacterium]